MKVPMKKSMVPFPGKTPSRSSPATMGEKSGMYFPLYIAADMQSERRITIPSTAVAVSLSAK